MSGQVWNHLFTFRLFGFYGSELLNHFHVWWKPILSHMFIDATCFILVMGCITTVLLCLALGQWESLPWPPCLGSDTQLQVTCKSLRPASVSLADMMLWGSERSSESFLTPTGTICQSWLWFKVSSTMKNRLNVCPGWLRSTLNLDMLIHL